MYLYTAPVLLCMWLITMTAADLPNCDEYDVTVLVTDGTAGKIMKLKYDLIQVKTLPVVMIYKPTAIVYDPVTTRIYWTDLDLKQIRSSDLDGRNEQKLVNLDSESAPYGLAIDPSARKLFYTDLVKMRIVIIDLDGSRHDDVLLDTEPDQPLDIVLHPKKQFFYWSTYKPLPYIARTNYAATTNKVLVNSGLMMPMGLTLDEENDILYWCDQLVKRIESVTTEGTNRRVILQKEFSFFDIFFHNDILYFTDINQKSVLYMSADGSSQVKSIGSSVMGQMARVFVFPSSPDNKTVTILGTDWTKSQIVSVTLRLPQTETLPISIITGPELVNYDPVTKRIYWTDVFLKHIRRINLDGTNETLVAELDKKAVPSGMAIDLSLRKLFYTDIQKNIIAAMDLSGENHKTILDTDLDRPKAIVLDEGKRVFYWIDLSKAPYIAEAHYDGTHKRIVVNTKLISPSSLALDKQDGILYWCDGLTHKVESISTDRSRRLRIRTTHLYAPTFYPLVLFWLDYNLFFGDVEIGKSAIKSMSGADITSIGLAPDVSVVGIHVFYNRNESACSSVASVDDMGQASANKYKPS